MDSDLWWNNESTASINFTEELTCRNKLDNWVCTGIVTQYALA